MKFKTLSQDAGTMPYMTVLTGFAIHLRRWTGCESAIIGFPMVDRKNRKARSLIGMFSYSLMLRIDFKGSPDFNEMLARVKHEMFAATENQDMSPEHLLKILKTEDKLDNIPKYRVVMNYLPIEIGMSLKLSDIEMTPVRTDAIRRTDLTLNFWEKGDSLYAQWQYKTDLFDPEMIAKSADEFRILLEKIAENPNMRIDEL